MTINNFVQGMLDMRMRTGKKDKGEGPVRAPEVPDDYDQCQLRYWQQELPAARVAALEGGDDEALAMLEWVVPGELLLALVNNCPDDAVKAAVSLRAYPIPHPPLAGHPDDFADLLGELKLGHQDLAYRDLYVEVLQQTRGEVLEQMHKIVTQMYAALITQMVKESGEKRHLSYELPAMGLPDPPSGPLAGDDEDSDEDDRFAAVLQFYARQTPRPSDVKFACLSDDNDPVAAALRSVKWKTTDLATPFRPWFGQERWEEMRRESLQADRTYVRRVIDWAWSGLPVAPRTDTDTLRMLQRYSSE